MKWILLTFLTGCFLPAITRFQPLHAQVGLPSNSNLSSEDGIDNSENNFSPDAQAIILSLQDAIERGLRKNNPKKIRDYSKELLEINFQDAFEDFWFPRLTLDLNTNDHYVESLYNEQEENLLPRSPNGTLSLGFQEYTLFNWGRDYLNYLNSKTVYKRGNQRIVEQNRFLRLGLIDQYFNTKRLQKIRRIKRSQLRHTAFIYRLNTERFSLKKIGRAELLQAKGEFLRAHKEYQDANANAADAHELMAELLGDQLQTRYILKNEIKFTPLSIKKSESQSFAALNAPTLREALANMKNSNRSYEKARKDNLPLPKFSVRLGAYRNTFSQAGSFERLSTYQDGRNVEIAASINMSWTLFGKGGLFNNREIRRSYISKRISEIELSEAKRDIGTNITIFHKKIRYLEKEFEATQKQRENNRLAFDATLDSYISGKTSFPNMKLVLDALIQAEINLEDAKYQHLSEKLNLANFIGLDDFPGEKFENMVLK